MVTPGNQWYALLLVLLVGFGARLVWLTVVAAGYLASHAAPLHVDGPALQRLGYGVALAVVAATVALTRRWTGRSTAPAPPAEPTGPASGGDSTTV